MALRVLVDGTPLAEEESRAFWKRFSDHMETNKGDLAGFAKAEGFASVHPAMGPEGAELRASRTKTQGPYRNVSKGDGGSEAVHAKGPSRPTSGGKPKRKPR